MSANLWFEFLILILGLAGMLFGKHINVFIADCYKEWNIRMDPRRYDLIIRITSALFIACSTIIIAANLFQ